MTKYALLSNKSSLESVLLIFFYFTNNIYEEILDIEYLFF